VALFAIYPKASHDLLFGTMLRAAGGYIHHDFRNFLDVGRCNNQIRRQYRRLMQVRIHAVGFGSDSASMA